MSVLSYNAMLEHSVDGTVWTEATGIIDLSGPKGKASDTKTTVLKSPNKHHTFQQGFIDAGSVEVTADFDKAMYATYYGLFQAPTLDATTNVSKDQWRITYADGSKIVMTGYINDWQGIDVPEDDRLTYKFSIKITGKPTYTAAP